ncbi:NADH-quinone oxidoreductase subunit K [Azospirillum halopraeferens]|uniref:NADH-quinone oxidoreductase subunit K n=1 Tax=Azospirillum halopraeferens TaxID=34010 RepID=UPI000409009C|nr:NADH-quinone oxidoreductase subunit K [Azospirillum halopraeferens]
MDAVTDAAPVFAVAGVLILAIGVFGIFDRPDLLGKIVALNVAASGAFTFMIGSAPVDGEGGPDTVLQALVLTGIVISISVTAYALSLLRRVADETGRDTLDAVDDPVDPTATDEADAADTAGAPPAPGEGRR